jgi:hypothetical protein
MAIDLLMNNLDKYRNSYLSKFNILYIWYLRLRMTTWTDVCTSICPSPSHLFSNLPYKIVDNFSISYTLSLEYGKISNHITDELILIIVWDADNCWNLVYNLGLRFYERENLCANFADTKMEDEYDNNQYRQRFSKGISNRGWLHSHS